MMHARYKIHSSIVFCNLIHYDYFNTDLTNPPTSVTLSIYPPAIFGYGAHVITCSPPLYAGSLNSAELKYKVFFESYDTAGPNDAPGCPTQPSDVCNFTCILDFTNNGYRVFYVQMVNTDGTVISQLSEGKVISAQLCDVYGKFDSMNKFSCHNGTCQ